MPDDTLPDDAEQPLVDLLETYRNLSMPNLRPSFPTPSGGPRLRAQPLQPRLSLPLKQRCLACREPLLAHLPPRLLRMPRQMDVVSTEGWRAWRACYSDTYFCTFSLFQTMPDSWAGEAALPHHAHPTASAERPHAPRRALRQTSAAGGGRQVDRVHRPPQTSRRPCPCTRSTAIRAPSAPSSIGAYREILGDPPNLFGDTATRASTCVSEQNKPAAQVPSSRRQRQGGARLRPSSAPRSCSGSSAATSRRR